MYPAHSHTLPKSLSNSRTPVFRGPQALAPLRGHAGPVHTELLVLVLAAASAVSVGSAHALGPHSMARSPGVMEQSIEGRGHTDLSSPTAAEFPAATAVVNHDKQSGQSNTDTSAVDKPSTQPAAPATRPQDQGGNPLAVRRGDPFYTVNCAGCDKPRWYKGHTIVKLYETRELRFCSQTCEAEFDADIPANMARLDQIQINDQLPFYSIPTSIVLGMALPEKPLDFIWNNRLLRVVDETEQREFLSDPERHLAALNRAIIESQLPTYPLMDKCPVQGDILETDEAISIVIANRMVRLCCRRCAVVVRGNPGQYLANVDYAQREAAKKRARPTGTAPTR